MANKLESYLENKYGAPSAQTQDDLGNPVYRIGEPLTAEEIKEIRDKENKKKEENQLTPEDIGDYPVYTGSTNLNCTFGDKAPRVFRNEEERRLGTALHAVMEGMRTESDLDRSIRKAMSRGIFTRKESEGYKKLIQEGLDFVRGKGHNWFGADLQVINEREIVYDEGNRTVRPDRIVVDRDGNATVIDYKFGDETHSGYRKQVKKYVDFLRETGQFHSVGGHVWYVKLRQIDKIE